MFNAFSPLEHLKALGIAYAVGVASTVLVSLYVSWAKNHDGEKRW